MNTAHTPTPWIAERGYEGFTIKTLPRSYGSAAGIASIEIADRATPENAAHIIACVNSHDELVRALRGLVEDMNALDAFPIDKLRAARAALAKVEG